MLQLLDQQKGKGKGKGKEKAPCKPHNDHCLHQVRQELYNPCFVKLLNKLMTYHRPIETTSLIQSSGGHFYPLKIPQQ